MIDLKKKEGESVNAFLFRFNKKVKQSGVLKEVKKRRFTNRSQNRNKRRSAALYRETKKKKLEQEKKYGYSSRKNT